MGTAILLSMCNPVGHRKTAHFSPEIFTGKALRRDNISSPSTRRAALSPRSPLSDDYAEIVEDEDDYSQPSNKDYELPRERVHLEKTIGNIFVGKVLWKV